MWLLALLLVGLAVLGAPLFAVLAGAAMLGFWHAETPLAVARVEQPEPEEPVVVQP